jgi:DinB superfamily
MRFRTGLGLICFAALCISLQAADTLTQGERDFAMSNMQATRKLFLDSVVGLTPEQWNFKAAPERWSIAECAEHIALSEDLISGMAKSTLAKPAETEKVVRGDEAREGDQKLLDAVVDRSHKAQAPEPLKPNHKFATLQEAVEHFKKSRDANIDYIEKTNDDLRAHSAQGPTGSPIDGYRWILLMSAHTERHTNQIKEVKADPNFPK